MMRFWRREWQLAENDGYEDLDGQGDENMAWVDDRPFLNNSVAKLGLLPQGSRAKRAPVEGGYEFTGGSCP